jgi:hypothetical protein
MDFYYLKNIAGRRLVGLRWWNEVDANTGDGRWVFESLDPETGRQINATDKRFFWLALYAQPVLWVLLAIVALVSLEFIWLTLVGMYWLFFLLIVGSGAEGKCVGLTNSLQLLRSSLRLRIRSLSPGAISSAKRLALPRMPCTVQVSRGTWLAG